MADQFGNNVDGEVWVPIHNHITRDIRAPGQCVACDQYHDRAMGVPVCYQRHELAPGVSQGIPHTECVNGGSHACS